MATLREVAETIAHSTGCPQADLAHRGRLLREAGLFPVSKRGKGATPVSPEGAAMLLLGLLATEHPAKTCLEVKRYGVLCPALFRVNGYYRSEWDSLGPKGAAATFQEFLTKIIGSFCFPLFRGLLGRSVLAVQVKRQASVPYAALRFFSGVQTRPELAIWELLFLPEGMIKDPVAPTPDFPLPAARGTLEVTAEVGGEVLIHIGEVVGRSFGQNDAALPESSLGWQRDLRLVAA